MVVEETYQKRIEEASSTFNTTGIVVIISLKEDALLRIDDGIANSKVKIRFTTSIRARRKSTINTM